MQPTVADVIQAARDVHPAFRADRAPMPALLGFLGRYIRRLAGAIAPIRPDAVVRTFDIDPATHDFDAGQALPGPTDNPPAPAVLLVTGGTVYDRNGDRLCDLEVVTFAQRHVRFRQRAALVDNGRIRLLGRKEEWNGISRVEVRYFPEPAAPTLGGTVDLPGSPLDAVSLACADFLAKRLRAAVSAEDRAQIHADWQEAEAAYLDDVTQRRVVRASQTSEDW